MPPEIWAVWDAMLRYASLLAIPALAFTVVMLARTVGKEQALQARILVLRAATPFLALAGYSLLMPVPVAVGPALGLLVLGLGVGAVWSMTTRVRLADGVVYGSRSVAYLFVWAVTMAVTQFFASIAWYRWVGYALPLMYLATGLAVGLNVLLIARRSALLKGG